MSGLSLGIGLTNACDRSCAHCYRPAGGPNHLQLGDVVRCLDAFDVGSVNLGTGENILNPALPAVLDLLHARGVRTSLTSNGLSLRTLDADRLRRLHDVEVSFDFATRSEMDAFRGEGAWDSAVGAVERCVGLGLPVTVLAVLLRNNHDRLPAVARLAAGLGASFRVNAFQPVHGDALMPTFDQFWDAWRRLFDAAALITCTEPVVAAVLDGAARSRPCGCGRTSVRLTPTGDLLPCVYWPRAAGQLADLTAGGGAALLDSAEFVRARETPPACRECPLFERCGGGCAARRALTAGSREPDVFCPRRDGREIRLSATLGPDVELLHAANVCTTLLRAD